LIIQCIEDIHELIVATYLYGPLKAVSLTGLMLPKLEGSTDSARPLVNRSYLHFCAWLRLNDPFHLGPLIGGIAVPHGEFGLIVTTMSPMSRPS
jgi:hypothetical protein